MALLVTKKKSKAKSKQNVPPPSSCFCGMLYKMPVLLFFLMVIFVWSSSTAIISGNFVHVCVTSRKLSNLYCVSAGTQPNYELPISIISNNTVINNNVTRQSSTVPVQHVSSVIRKNEESLFAEANQVPSATTTNQHSLPEVNQVPSPFQHISSVITKNEESLVAVHHQVPTPVTTNNYWLPEVNQVPSPVTKEEALPVLQEVTSSPVRSNNIEKDSKFGRTDEEYLKAVKDVEEQLQTQRSWISSSTNHEICDGRGIFVYDLPTKFNKGIVERCDDMVPWMNFCDYFKNEAMGEPVQKLGKGWYDTHQYALELMFHTRVLKHPCRVFNENDAKLFYVPYYGGMDILRWHFKNVSANVKDSLGMELIQWLETQATWKKNDGKDHVFVLGKISWDFRRPHDGSVIGPVSWGTRFLEHAQMQTPLKLLIERQPWHINDIGVPHPTYFHPHTDEDILQWQTKIISSGRINLIAFAGAERPGDPDNIRSVLVKQCVSRNDSRICQNLDCKSGGCLPETIIELFTQTDFCLQPPGDSPTRKSLFDSLISGCIPVLFDPFTAYYQYPWHLPQNHSRYSIFIDKDELRKMNVDVVERLAKITQKEKDDMRRTIVYELLPGLIYGDSSSEFDRFQDAFSISINNLLDRVTRLSSSNA